MDTQTNYFIRFITIIFFLLIPNQVFSSCDDSLDDGVDYSNCQFSDGQDLAGSFLPNSNLSFSGFIKVNFESIASKVAAVKTEEPKVKVVEVKEEEVKAEELNPNEVKQEE